MVDKVVQSNTWDIQMGLDVLFHSARDENAKGYRRISLEEQEHIVDKLLNLFFIVALVQPIQDDEKRASCQSPDRSSFNAGLEWSINQTLHPGH
jgi:hypothetical protein